MLTRASFVILFLTVSWPCVTLHKISLHLDLEAALSEVLDYHVP